MKLSNIAIAAAVVFSSASAIAAEYRVIPLPTNDIGVNSFGQVITNDGAMVSVVQNEYNPDIDLSFLDFDNEAFVALLTDPDSAKEGNFNATDLAFIVSNFLNGPTSQRLSSSRSYVTDGSQIDLIPGFDEITPLFDDYTGSVASIVRDGLDRNTFVGRSEGLFYKVPYTNADGDDIVYVVSDLAQNGFVQVDGVVTRLAPLEATLGGVSEAFSINNNMQVAGRGTVTVSATLTSNIETCQDEEQRGDEPLEKCLFDLTGLIGTAQRNAHVWQLDNAGTVIDLKTYGFLFEPEADDTTPYASTAYDINDLSIAVGTAATGEIAFTNRQPVLQTVAVSFEGDTINELLPRDENIISEALLINDDYIVGTVSRDFTSSTRKRLFIYNIENESVEYPEGFFTSSTTVPRAININNVIVGEAESSILNAQSRDKSAFKYNVNTQEFINLNNLIACNSPYDLVDAVDINDNNEILVNARVRAPIKNSLGDPVINDDGEEIIVDQVVVVKLEPISGGVAEDCNAADDTFERSGASIGHLMLFMFGIAVFLRRFRR